MMPTAQQMSLSLKAPAPTWVEPTQWRPKLCRQGSSVFSAARALVWHWKNTPWTQPRTDHCAEPPHTANGQSSHTAGLTRLKGPALWLWVVFSLMLLAAISCSASWAVHLDPCC